MNRLKVLVDHCVPVTVVSRLQERAIDVLRVTDVLPADAPDETVLATAQSLDAVVISLNGDFADIVRYPPEAFGGIVSLQLHNHPENLTAVMDRLVGFLESMPHREALRGKLILVEPHRVRIRQ